MLGVAGVAVAPVPGHTVGQRTVAWPRAQETSPHPGGRSAPAGPRDSDGDLQADSAGTEPSVTNPKPVTRV